MTVTNSKNPWFQSDDTYFLIRMSGLFIPLCFQSQEAERGTSHAPGVASVKQWCQAEAEYLSECIYMQAAASVAEVESVEYRSEIATALERSAKIKYMNISLASKGKCVC